MHEMTEGEIFAVLDEEREADRHRALRCGPAGTVPAHKPSPRVRRKDPETSRAAAESIEPHLSKSQAWLMVLLIGWRKRGKEDFTDKELVDECRTWERNAFSQGLNIIRKGLRAGSGIRTRRHELAEMGKLELVCDEAGEVVTRQRCRVWRLA